MAASDQTVVIAAGARTPVGSFNGTLSTVPASYLGTVALRAAIERARLEAREVEEVILGQILTAGQGQNPARQASMCQRGRAVRSSSITRMRIARPRWKSCTTTARTSGTWRLSWAIRI